MNGTQLKALQGVRLPETEPEWEAVRETLEGLSAWLKDETSPDLFLAELKQLAAHAQDWWENRTKREGAARLLPVSYDTRMKTASQASPLARASSPADC